jgi:hypothetical protein
MKKSERIINNANGIEYYKIMFEILNHQDITSNQYNEISYFILQKVREFTEINSKNYDTTRESKTISR